MFNNVNGLTGQFLYVMICMASLCLGLGTCSEKVMNPTITFLFPAILALLWSIMWMDKMDIYICLWFLWLLYVWGYIPFVKR